jgi:hypothetical protein
LHAYTPLEKWSLYSPVNGGSVPLCIIIASSLGVSLLII